jgi:hypothetical protein
MKGIFHVCYPWRAYQNLLNSIIHLQAEQHFTALQPISKPSGKGFDIGFLWHRLLQDSANKPFNASLLPALNLTVV